VPCGAEALLLGAEVLLGCCYGTEVLSTEVLSGMLPTPHPLTPPPPPPPPPPLTPHPVCACVCGGREVITRVLALVVHCHCQVVPCPGR
jgi:hypothetical protein